MITRSGSFDAISFNISPDVQRRLTEAAAEHSLSESEMARAFIISGIENISLDEAIAHVRANPAPKV